MGVAFPRVLLPADTVDYAKWAVIACDQYTSEPEYWSKVERIVGDAPSTLRLMLPEVYLDAPDVDARLAQIADTTASYLSDGLLAEYGPAPVLVVRETGSGRRRLGLLLAFDLEHYEFSRGSTSLIRPTEETIVERLPPRVRIRKAAAAEFPHILVLIDDSLQSVVEPVFRDRDRLPLLYDTELMLGGGAVSGYAVNDPEMQHRLVAGIEACMRRAEEESSGDPLLFAVGDGNHSLATAKRVWEEAKAAGAPPDHPSRFALAELVNIYDAGLVFEPIHRIVIGDDPESLLDRISNRCGASDNADDALDERTIRWITPRESGALRVPGTELAGVLVQRAIEELTDVGVDYIHGDESLGELVHTNQALGILMPSLTKAELFPLVRERGVLPRKMFSLGEAAEKRYYVEGRVIRR